MQIINALTVDVEDYFQVSAFEQAVARDGWDSCERRVVANTGRLLDLFAERGVRATFFVLGWVAEREPALVERIASAGHEVASHGYGHRLVYDQTPAEFRDDVRRARKLLQEASGQAVIGYRAPSFSITGQSLWALDILAEEGYLYDTSIFPIRHDRYGIPSAPRHPFLVDGTWDATRTWDAKGTWAPALAGASGPWAPATRTWAPASAGAADPRRPLAPASAAAAARPPLLEIPASTIRLAGANLPIAGGGYFRLLPYAWTRWGIRRLNEREARPAVFYLHPWEVDPEQPRLRGSLLSRFRHYRHLAQTESRLQQLLEDFRFGSIVEAILAPAPVVV